MNNPPCSSIDLYAGSAYADQHPNWHLEDAPGKAADILDACQAVLKDSGKQVLTFADVGAGVGGVLHEVLGRLERSCPSARFHGIGFELAPFAATKARELYPHLEIRQKLFESSDGPFDMTMLVDVLEHLENPWEMLRTVRTNSRYLVVRQPLEEGFPMFRHKSYARQRERLGHVGFFNWHSFLDMASATGWQPLEAKLLAPWELHCYRRHRPCLKSLLVRFNRPIMSHFISGFYMIGAFKAA